MALYVRSLRSLPLFLLLLLLLLLRHVIAIFLSGVGHARERPGTRYRRVCDKKEPEKSERIRSLSLLPCFTASPSHRRRRARNSFSVPVPSGAVTFRHLPHGPEAGSTANPFAAIRDTYEEFIRAEAGRVWRHAHLRPSFRVSFAGSGAIRNRRRCCRSSRDFLLLLPYLSHHPATSGSASVFSHRTLMSPAASPNLFSFPGAFVRFFRRRSGDFLDRWRFKHARERASLSKNLRVFVRLRRTKSLAPFDGRSLSLRVLRVPLILPANPARSRPVTLNGLQASFPWGWCTVRA